MKTLKTWKKLSAREIIVGKDGETEGGYYTTGDIIWTYRTDYLEDGIYDDQGPCVCSPCRANCITIEAPGRTLARLEL